MKVIKKYEIFRTFIVADEHIFNKQANQKQRSQQTVSWLVGALPLSLRKSEKTPEKTLKTRNNRLRQFLHPK